MDYVLPGRICLATSVTLAIFFPSLDGRDAEKIDFWGYAFTFGGFRGIPQWNHKMFQSHGFAVTTML